MIKSTLLIACVLLLITGCRSSSSSSDSGQINDSTNTDGTTNTNNIGEADIVPNSMVGSGSITSVFNGYRLVSSSRRTRDGITTSKFYYEYDSENRSITKLRTRSETASIDTADASSITVLTKAGLPGKTGSYHTDGSGEFGNVTTRQYSATNQLLSYTTIVQSDGAERYGEYTYNSNGQPLSSTIIGIGGKTFAYSANGLLESVSFSLTNFMDFKTVRFEHDNLDRLSGYESVERLTSLTFRATFVWDENNNVKKIDRFNDSGELISSSTFEYEKTDELIYNAMLFDYIFEPNFR